MNESNYVKRALMILDDENSSEVSRRIAWQILRNAGLLEDDISQCLRMHSTDCIYLFEA
ncbi:hypothetical protein [Alteromonas sp. H39]|uniref:hypothetical protein n=1 Tax=Alteromonas sp. H39 TaxID=3389876 RepID=UPI0039E09513